MGLGLLVDYNEVLEVGEASEVIKTDGKIYEECMKYWQRKDSR